jgi:hypothetical protein
VHLGTRFRAGVVVLATTVSLSLSLAAMPRRAEAQLPAIPLTPSGLLGTGVGKIISDLTCDPLRTVANPLGEFAVGVSDLLCRAGVLDYSFYTVFKQPDGTLVKRTTPATLLLPTPIEVGDGDPLPDLIGTFVPTSLSRFRLSITRAPLETRKLPLSAEFIVDDPTGGLPREHINFGYDALGSDAPQALGTTVDVGSSGSEAGAVTVSLNNDILKPRATLDILGGLFDGTPDARTDPVGARLHYEGVPDEAGVALAIGRKLGVRATASTPTRLTADFASIDGPSSLRAKAVMDLLPNFAEFTYEPLGTDRRKFTYAAGAAMNRLDVDYGDRPGGVLAQAALVRAQAVPTGMVVEQTSKSGATFDATGGALGRAEVGFGIAREPKLLTTATTPYGYVLDDAAGKSFAGRVDGLTHARFEGTDDRILVDATLAARTPFLFKVDTPTMQADGDLADLPKKVHALVDLAGGRIDYDGNGDTIGRVTLARAIKPAGFFPTAEPPLRNITRISGELRDMPPAVTVRLKPESGPGAGFTATAPVGSVEATLSSDDPTGRDAGLPAGESGMHVEDLPSRFTVFGRVTGLREVTVKKSSTGALTADAKLARQPLHLIYRKILTLDPNEPPSVPPKVAPGDTTVDARLSPIPDSVHFTMDAEKEEMGYTGSQGIDQADVTVTAEHPLVARARRVVARVRGIPTSAGVVLVDRKDGTNGFGVSAIPQLDSVEVLLSDKPTATLADGPLPAGESGAFLRDIPSEYTVHGRVRDVHEVTVGENASGTLTATAKIGRQPLHLNARKILALDPADPPTNPPTIPPGDTTVDVRTTDIPDDITFTMDASKQAMTYRAAQGIDRIDVTASSENPLVKKARRAVTRITGVPAAIDLFLADLPKGQLGASFRAVNGAVQTVEALLSDKPTADLADGALPSGESGVAFRDLPGDFQVHGRINGLSRLSLTRDAGEVLRVGAQVAPQKLHAIFDGATDPAQAGSPVVHLDARTSEIPANTSLVFSPKQGTASYSGDATIDTLDATLDADKPLFGLVKHIVAHVTGIPKQLTVTFKPSSGSGGAFETNSSVKLIEARLSDGTTTVGDLPADQSGVNVLSTSSAFALVGRLQEVKGASVVTDGDDLTGEIRTGPLAGGTRQSFTIDAKLPQSNGSTQPFVVLRSEISDLPSRLKITKSGTKLTYDGEESISTVKVHAFDLAGGQKGKINRAEATLTSVPTLFTIDTGDATGVTVDRGGGFGRIDASLWDQGDPLGAPAEDGRNKVLMNTRDGQFKVLARIFALKKAVLTDLFGITIDTAFNGPPAPLDFQLLNKAGTPSKDASIDVTASELPSTAKIFVGDLGTVRGETLAGTVLGYEAGGDTADVHAEIRTPGAVALLDAPNIPGRSHVCFGSGLAGCGAKAPQVFNTEDDDINGGTDVAIFPNDVAIVTDSSGTLELSGKVCTPPTNDKGTPLPDAVANYNCAGETNFFLTFSRLRVKDMRLEFASGNAVNEDDDGGGPGEDGLLKLYVDTDETGIKVDDLRSVNTASNDVIHLQKGADPPFRNTVAGDPFSLVIDLDTNFTPFDAPDVELWNGRQIDCRNITLSPKILGTELDVIPVIKVYQEVPGTDDICRF